MNKLDQLKSMSQVVTDNGDPDSIVRYQPGNATTNPSLLFEAADSPRCQVLPDEARRRGRAQGAGLASMAAMAFDYFDVSIGHEVLQIVPVRVSTAGDARLCFGHDATIARDREELAARLVA